jgi:hypothetical protein
MLPEVEEFLTVKKAADKEYNDWHRHSRDDQPRRPARPSWDNWGDNGNSQEWDDYRTAHELWNDKYQKEYQINEEKHREVLRAARKKLRAKTKDPIVKWMMDNIHDHWSYVEEVLPELPATREELEDLASRKDWCTEFDDFLDQATEAGIVPPRNEAWDASDLVEWVASEYDVYERTVRREIQSRVNKIVERALAVAHNEKATS